MAENLNKISRPRQLFVGEKPRKFINIEDREEKPTNITEIPKLSKITNLMKI